MKYGFISENEELMKEWNWEKNNSLGIFPDKLSTASKLKVWWKCQLNHEWENTIYHRSIRLQNCPYCSNFRVWAGYNDLATTHPDMLCEWNYELNKDILPTNVSYGSNKKVWWKCDKNHSFFMAISDKRKQGCPICSNKMVLIGYNDLMTTHPNLAKEWNYYKNKDVLPTQITYGSEKKFWWKCCKCNYEWVATPNNRTNNSTKGTGCPCCSNRIVVPGINDLATTHPDIAKRWHPTLNKLKPTEVVAGCNSKAYFTCDKDSRHYFYTRINHMVSDNIQCPVCANQKIIVGVNDLATTHPELLMEWDFGKNITTPT
jgi:DNA-directed RNA polymerase subunit RPC12/RpoP